MLSSTLERFYVESRLKSCLFEGCFNHQERCSSTHIIVITYATSIGKYLGHHVLKGRVTKADFQHVIEKVQSRMESWKSKLLNRARRLCLTKSIHFGFPKIHDLVKGSLTKMLEFGELEGYYNAQICRWTRGQRYESNYVSLLGKLIWELLHCSHKPWVQVISHKHLHNNTIIRVTNIRGAS
ncbi:hypothetical protein CR513_08090, partial [Mucuna pruriens]